MSWISSLALPPLTVAYGAVTRLRLAAYESGILQASRLPVPVISVGNITVGGTGKTPLVLWVSRMLAREGRKVGILTRGYGRSNARHRVVVSDGSKILADVRQSGDEPQLLAEHLKGVAAVICDSSRTAAGLWAIEHLGTDALVLDDGFQHLRLARDLNILTIDATNPWGGGHLLPYGRLREPRSSLSRADCVVITRTKPDADIAALRTEIQRFGGSGPMFTSRMQNAGVRVLGCQQSLQVDLARQPVAAFCAVGNAGSFFGHLEEAGLDLVYTKAFPDHYDYRDADIQSVALEAKRSGAATLITTAKDEVKLRRFDFPLPCHVWDIEISIDQQDALIELIRAALTSRQ